MQIQIKNWWLFILAILFIGIFTALGVWQLSRANQKKNLLATFAKRSQAQELTLDALQTADDLRFYRVRLKGQFDAAHTFLLDNKIQQGQVGYELYTPFKVFGLKLPILVDRGFIPLGKSRDRLPRIHTRSSVRDITGILKLPPAYLRIGPMTESPILRWPLRIEYLNLSEIGMLLNLHFFPYVVVIAANDPEAYASEWQITTLPPERHLGYAVQWFALALTLLILSIVLSCRRSS